MTRLFPYYQSYQRPNVITSQVSLSLGLLVVVLASCCTTVYVCIYLFWIGNVPRFLQRIGAFLNAFNAREYVRHSLELGANAPRLS